MKRTTRTDKKHKTDILSRALPALLISVFLTGCASKSPESVDSSNSALARTEDRTDISESNEQAGTGATMSEEKKTETNSKLDLSESPAARSDDEWREILTPEQYHVMRECGTERAFTGEYWNTKTPGVYLCAGCGQELFDSEEKYESGSGWPSFWKAGDSANVAEITDHSLGMVRTEITCGRCGAHLGHLFEDGPQPTGLRYCVNSAALKLKPDSSTQDKSSQDDNDK